MCYSAESSIQTYWIGLVSSLILLIFGSKYDKALGLFFLPVIHVQLAEYFIWTDLECKGNNQIATRGISILLGLHIYFIILASYLFKTSYISMKYIKYIFYIITLLLLYYIYRITEINKNISYCTKVDKNNSLKWNFKDGFFPDKNDKNYLFLYFSTYIYFIIGMLIPLFNYSYQGFITLFFLFGTFHYNFYYNKDTYTSNWCYFSAFTPLILTIILLKNKMSR